jgi:hypothetical protein
MAENAINVRRILFGPENKKTLDLEMLGLVYSLGGQ